MPWYGSLHEDDHVIEDKGKAQKADTHWNQKGHIPPVSRLAGRQTKIWVLAVLFKFNFLPSMSVFLCFITKSENRCTKTTL